jgi:hypothetical protein
MASARLLFLLILGLASSALFATGKAQGQTLPEPAAPGPQNGATSAPAPSDSSSRLALTGNVAPQPTETAVPAPPWRQPMVVAQDPMQAGSAGMRSRLSGRVQRMAAGVVPLRPWTSSGRQWQRGAAGLLRLRFRRQESPTQPPRSRQVDQGRCLAPHDVLPCRGRTDSASAGSG